ncbi:hypothetical protein EVAR_69167_1 [Eumeta japonica]|uniref:Uncharacterized protein n=1 Tax=Eumeta variegata TaxID=151549 RepID=A0A4C1ZHW0_EUMVA|nr:hypothetical protein EVAR_69167_1 [Eumeta japonica]
MFTPCVRRGALERFGREQQTSYDVQPVVAAVISNVKSLWCRTPIGDGFWPCAATTHAAGVEQSGIALEVDEFSAFMSWQLRRTNVDVPHISVGVRVLGGGSASGFTGRAPPARSRLLCVPPATARNDVESQRVSNDNFQGDYTSF